MNKLILIIVFILSSCSNSREEYSHFSEAFTIVEDKVITTVIRFERGHNKRTQFSHNNRYAINELKYFIVSFQRDNRKRLLPPLEIKEIFSTTGDEIKKINNKALASKINKLKVYQEFYRKPPKNNNPEFNKYQNIRFFGDESATWARYSSNGKTVVVNFLAQKKKYELKKDISFGSLVIPSMDSLIQMNYTGKSRVIGFPETIKVWNYEKGQLDEIVLDHELTTTRLKKSISN